ncbi:rCG51305 [Rattus norvegicus]|uniref:RCG51305 n=1 Tax=Rattus norvegicus TaxID=10116 RepID=A6IZR7_RAT|nr:rCG51305 [Rattus norvegicus]
MEISKARSGSGSSQSEHSHGSLPTASTQMRTATRRSWQWRNACVGVASTPRRVARPLP